MTMTFKEAYDLPIGKHVEKKGKFSYLSWCFAVRYLRENYPEAVWVIHENHIGQPIFDVNGSFMVKVSVIVDGLEYAQWHPILNHQNKPIERPSAFDINTSIQRCLTKAIGLATGIGLGLYAGEDLPKEETKYVESKLPKWEQEADTYNTADERKEWYLANEKKIFTELTKQEVALLQSYLTQLKDAETKQ